MKKLQKIIKLKSKMYDIFLVKPNEFKKKCLEKMLKKQQELDNVVEKKDTYIKEISSKRINFENEYSEYLLKTENIDYINKVNLFVNEYPIKLECFNIYTYE